jgi:hypothetical protein
MHLRVDPASAPGHAALGIYFFTLTVMGLLDHPTGLRRRAAQPYARSIWIRPAPKRTR